ncbi:MAG: FtsX-like permease family protein [Thermoleophilaceae bacterium]|nr:FtsX-like permease family protein [Thermoleophilaceae bacterium]
MKTLASKLNAKVATTLLLTRHILRTMTGQVARTALVWLALVAALAVTIGVVSFIRSVDNSFQARGSAVRGVASVQVQAVAPSTFSSSLAHKVEKVKGTRYAVALDEQRIAISSQHSKTTVATAFGIDKRARLLRSDLQRQLNVKTPKDPSKGGLTVSTVMAQRLGVERGDKVRILAFSRSPQIKIQRIVKVAPALEDVVAVPRKSVERLRGPSSGPNVLYVKLERGTDLVVWRKHVKRVLPVNALVVTPTQQQHELDTILNFTTRSYTYVFGSVALLIATLLVYVLQLMRMLDRQEDAGLVRALGSSWGPLAAAEVLALIVMLIVALPAGVFFGHQFGGRLSANLPEFLTQVFNFTMNLEVSVAVVVGAACATLMVGVVATVGALATTRRPIADQLGRSPQSGATATARMSMPAAIALTLAGLASFALASALTHWHDYTATAMTVLLGIGLITPGVTTLVIFALMRIRHADGAAALVARSALESNPRRVGMSAAIMALAVTAVIPLQLLDRALEVRTNQFAAVHNPAIKRVAASNDVFTTVPMRPDFARRVLNETHKKAAAAPQLQPGQVRPTRAQLMRRADRRALHKPLPSYAIPFATGFTRYRSQRIGVMAIDSSQHWPYLGSVGLATNFRKMHRHRRQVSISSQLASWTGLAAGDKIKVPTPKGVKKLKITSVVDDMSWPLGTVYFDISRYRELYGWNAINSLIVKPGKIDRKQVAKLRPLYSYSGATVSNRIRHQMNMTRSNILAMRLLIVLAAMVAISGILSTSVLARRREWGVLRAVGMNQSSLLLALAIELALILTLGTLIGTVGGLITYEGPILSFMANQGFPLARNIVVLPLIITALSAITVGLLAVMISAVHVARTKLTDALSYE